MSLRDLAESDVTTVLLNVNDFGETVKRWPGGNSGAQQNVTAVWEPDETGDRMADMGHEASAFTGALWVAETTEVDAGDVWVIGGVRYATQVNNEVVNSLRRVTVKRVDKVQTSRHSGDFY